LGVEGGVPGGSDLDVDGEEVRFFGYTSMVLVQGVKIRNNTLLEACLLLIFIVLFSSLAVQSVPE
jgi:hypothetical protein